MSFLKKPVLLTLCFISFFLDNYVLGQCPTISSSDLFSADCTNGTTPCDLCIGDVITLSATGSNLPNGSCINWYYSTTPNFNPYSGQGTLMGCSPIASTMPSPCDQCPEIQAIFVDACGSDNDNEFFIFSSGSGFNTSDLSVGYPTTVVMPGVNDNVPPCPIQFPTISVSGCANVIYVGPGTNVPPGVPVVFFVSSGATTIYDVSALCGAEPVYVMQSGCNRDVAAFRNFCGGGCGFRDLTISLSCGCSSNVSYEPGLLSNGADGDYVTGGGAYGNSGCAAPFVNIPPAPGGMSTIDPFDFVITPDLCNLGPYYVRGIISPNPSIPGCPQEITIAMPFNVLCPTADIMGDDEICPGESSLLTASGASNYLWSTGAITSSISVSPLISSSYSVTVSEGNCQDVATFDVTVIPPVSPILSNTTLCENDAPFDLSNLNDPNFPNGFWTGTGVFGGFFDPSGLTGSNTVTFNSNDFCVSDGNAQITVNTPQLPILQGADLCENDAPIDLSILIDPAYPNGTWSGPGVTSNFFDPSGLTGLVDIFFQPFDDCTEEAQTTINVLPVSLPDLGTASICESSGGYNLNQLNDPAYPLGSWTGPNVVNNIFDPSSQNGNVILTFTPADPCAGANTTTISVSPSAVPVLGTDTICENGGLFDLNPLRDPLYQNGIWTGTGVRTNRYLNPVGLNGPVSVTFVPTGNCIDTVSTLVTVVASGTPALLRDTICQTSGIYNLSQLLDPLYPTGTWIGPGVINNQFNPAGRFGNINLIFNSDQPCINQTQTVIRVLDQIAYQNVRINCDGSNQSYTVIFDIVRGDTANYQVTGTGGTLTGTTFTSVPIASGDSYSFNISDGSPCAPLTLSGNFDCNCVTSAGTMQIPPVALTFCAQQTAIVNHNGNQILDGNDLLQFILHTSSTDQPGMILATNSSPQFDFQLGTMDYNILYYISAIAGNNDGSGNVSLTDSCLSVAPGVPIIFYPEPVASFLTEGIICRGDTFNLQIFFQGKSPFYYELAVNGDPQGVDSTEFGIITIPVTPDTTTIYELLSYRDSFCIGSFLDSVAIVRVRQPLQLTPLDTIFYPNGTYAVILNASGGDTASYVMSGNSGVLNGTIFTSDPIPCGDTISVQLADANFCTPANYSGPVECTSTCTSFAGILSPADTIRICPNESGSFTHTGYIFDDNDTLIYVIDTVRHTEIPAGVFTTQQTTIVNSGNFLSGVRYYVTAFVGDSTATGLVNSMDTCLAFAAGPVLIFLTSPSVQFDNELVICQGDSINLNLDFQGRAPFTFTYSVNGTQLSPITTSNASYQLQVPFNTPGQVVIRSVFDLFCATNVNDTVDVTFYEPVEALISDLSCDSTTREFTVTVQIRGGDTMSYQVSGVQGVLTGTTFVSSPIRSDSVFTLYVFDGNSCDSVVLSGTINCNCATNAGSFQLNPSPLGACGNDPVTAIHLNNQRLDGDDVLQFVLHDNPGNILGNILATNNQPVFSFQAGMLLGTTYYISAVAGNSLPDGTVDPGDPCRSVSQGVPVIFFPNPGVVYMVEDTVCQNDCISISLTFTGIPPFELNYATVFGQDTTHDNYQAGNLNGSIVFCNPFTPGVAQFETTSVSSHGCTTDLSNSMAEEITILPTALNEIRETLCGNKSITVNNIVFNQNNPADTFYLDGAAANGCDSVIMVNLTFVPSPSSMLDTTICTGDFIVVNGTRYDATNRTGQEIIALNPFCDSIVNVNLNFFPENRVTLNNTLCEGDQIVVNGNIYNQSRPSGTEILQAANGCDSTIVISLSFHPVQNTNLNDTLCFGETLTVGASTFSAANPSGTVNLSTTNGCDSIVNVNLHFLQDLTNTVTDTLCANEQLTIGAEIFNRNRPSGSVILTSANGCDSTINVNLNFRPEVIASLSGDAKICEGDSAILVFNLNSSALVNVRITDDQNQALNLNGLSDGSEVIVRPSVTSTYTLVGVTISGSNCPATLSGAANVEVSNLQINTQLSDYEGFNLSCNGERDGSARLIPLQGILPYQVSWSTGDNGMLLQNLSAGTYIFTITDGAGCSKTDSVTLNEPEGILPEIFANDPNCLTQQPGSISIESVTGGAAPYSIKVENGPYVPMSVIPYTVSNLQPGNFDITIRDANNCEVDSKVTISPILEPEVSLGRDTVIGLGDSILIRASSNIIPASVSWEPPMFLSCDTCLNTFSRPNQNISYRITITDAAGCTATDDLRIEVLKLRNVFIPSAFSPDDDGINDVFSIFGDDEAVKIRRFQIFDRWGNLVYSSADIPLNDPNIGWDGRYKGKRMDPAVFVFWVEIEFLDGETEIFKGDITLLHSN